MEVIKFTAYNPMAIIKSNQKKKRPNVIIHVWIYIFSVVDFLLEIDKKKKKFSIIGYMTVSRTLSSGSDYGSAVALMKYRIH